MTDEETELADQVNDRLDDVLAIKAKQDSLEVLPNVSAQMRQYVGADPSECHASGNTLLRWADKLDEAAEQAERLRDALWDAVQGTDSYGVPGSDWAVCSLCEGEDEPGIYARGVAHKKDCLLYGHWSCRSNKASSEGYAGERGI